MIACPSQARSVLTRLIPAVGSRSAAMHRPDCEAHESQRSSAFPMVILLAERFAKTVASASAAYVLKGIGVQRSRRFRRRSRNRYRLSPRKSNRAEGHYLPEEGDFTFDSISSGVELPLFVELPIIG